MPKEHCTQVGVGNWGGIEGGGGVGVGSHMIVDMFLFYRLSSKLSSLLQFCSIYKHNI